MLTAATGISENGPCLVSHKFIKSVYKVLSLFTEMQFSTDLALMETQPTY